MLVALVASIAFGVARAPVEAQPPPAAAPAAGGSQPLALPAGWQGAEALLILVTDEQGRGLPDVAVTLRLGDAPESLHGLRTDAEGRLELAGLAAGEWQVDLGREGFMLYTAYLKVEPAKAPEVAFSSRQRTGTYWAPLQAVFLRPGDASTAAASAALRTGRATAQRARRETEQQARQDRRAEERLERRVRRGDTARVVDPPAASEPSERPRAAVAEPAGQPATTATTAPPAAAPESVRAPTPSPAASTPAAPAEAPREAPIEAPVDPPSPSPAPLLPNPTLRQAGACVECQPGEWSVSSAGRAATAGPCPAADQQLVAAARLVAGGLRDGARAFAGSLYAEDSNDALRLLPAELATAAREQVGAFASSASSCVALGLVLPAGARYVGFRYEAGERSTFGDCPIGGDCQIGEASWRGQPVITQESGVTVVHAVFENRSTRRERLPRLTVYFRPPAGWLPPS